MIKVQIEAVCVPNQLEESVIILVPGMDGKQKPFVSATLLATNDEGRKLISKLWLANKELEEYNGRVLYIFKKTTLAGLLLELLNSVLEGVGETLKS